MMRTAIAYLPLDSYPDGAPDAAITATVAFGAALGPALQVTTFAVDIPPMRSPLGGLMLDVQGMARQAEDRSHAECLRLEGIVRAAAAERIAGVTLRRCIMGGAPDAAAEEARYFDVSLLPWSGAGNGPADLAQAVVFGSGRPSILVPPTARPMRPDHLAIAWDGSRVAARALGDALALLPDLARVTVLTVQDEKPMEGQGIAARVAAMLERRGMAAVALEFALGKRTIGSALQEAAGEAGADLLAMGGFGHARIRDFILGGATRDVLADLRLPILLSH